MSDDLFWKGSVSLFLSFLHLLSVPDNFSCSIMPVVMQKAKQTPYRNWSGNCTRVWGLFPADLIKDHEEHVLGRPWDASTAGHLPFLTRYYINCQPQSRLKRSLESSVHSCKRWLEECPSCSPPLTQECVWVWKDTRLTSAVLHASVMLFFFFIVWRKWKIVNFPENPLSAV